jgi:two-component system response regulator FixJ
VIHVIDDDDAARDALTFLLSAANFSVRAYESAKAFFTDVPTSGTGCIITDVRMPEISGLELLRQLKSNGISCPVIVVTGQADVPVAIEAIKLGAVDFIEKPYDAEVLLGAVRFALSGQASEGRDAQRAEIQQRLAALSPQERQVLQSLVDGRPNSSIAHVPGMEELNAAGLPNSGSNFASFSQSAQPPLSLFVSGALLIEPSPIER